jgi:hypothetical protein
MLALAHPCFCLFRCSCRYGFVLLRISPSHHSPVVSVLCLLHERKTITQNTNHCGSIMSFFSIFFFPFRSLCL